MKKRSRSSKQQSSNNIDSMDIEEDDDFNDDDAEMNVQPNITSLHHVNQMFSNQSFEPSPIITPPSKPNTQISQPKLPNLME